MFDEKLKVAYSKSIEILELIQAHPRYDSDSMMDTSIVLECVKQKYCNTVSVEEKSFSSLGISKPFGAMMLTEFAKKKPKEARIVLNADANAIFQRFSLLHELGHLIVADAPEVNASGKYVISTHIDYNVTNITKEQYEGNSYLLKEQIANIFALRVLMPTNQFYKKMQDLDDIANVAEFFGVTYDAVVSRMMIGA